MTQATLTLVCFAVKEEAKPFILEYFKLYTGRLWEELVDA